MIPAARTVPMTLELDWPDPRLITLWQVNRLPERLPALVEALVDTPTCLLPIGRQVRTPVLGEPLRLAGLLYAWPDGRSLIGLEAADGSRYRLLERDGEARQYFGPAAVYRHTVRAETLEGCPPALRFCLAHRTWPSWDAQWEERHRTALAWIERALRHLAALDHQWTARAAPDTAWTYALTRNPHLVGTLRLGEGYPEFDPSQPRDGRGRWTDGGGGDADGGPWADSPDLAFGRTESLEDMRFIDEPTYGFHQATDQKSGKETHGPVQEMTLDRQHEWNNRQSHHIPFATGIRAPYPYRGPGIPNAGDPRVNPELLKLIRSAAVDASAKIKTDPRCINRECRIVVYADARNNVTIGEIQTTGRPDSVKNPDKQPGICCSNCPQSPEAEQR